MLCQLKASDQWLLPGQGIKSAILATKNDLLVGLKHKLPRDLKKEEQYRKNRKRSRKTPRNFRKIRKPT